MNKSKKTKMSSAVIARNDEYLFYQVLIGTWPLTSLTDSERADYQERIQRYMIKAVREAKQHTSWFNPNEDYEQAVSQFVRRCLDVNASPLFLTDFTAFERQIRKPGLYNALAQTVLHLTSSGVPDIYQGNELWQLLSEMDAMLAKPDVDRPQFISSLLENNDCFHALFFAWFNPFCLTRLIRLPASTISTW